MEWFRDAVVYELQVPRFMDGDGDGLGDLVGLTSRLEYLADLGVTCLWLGPFFDSPRQDDGYDVRDYYAIDPALGTEAQFERLMHRLDSLGMRAIVDMPFNHTSVEHHWFQSARSDPGSPYRDFYQWSDEPGGDVNVVGEPSAWTYDEAAGRYYYHAFFGFQPDLDLANPRVRAELAKVVDHWMGFGVSGFRLDAVPLMLDEPDEQGFDLLADIRRHVEVRWPEAVVLAEGDVGPAELTRYFGDGDRVHAALSFYTSAHLGLALVEGRARALERALRTLRPPPAGCTYANFVRSHDEWSFRQVGEEERQAVFAAFDPTGEGRMFRTGLRRRLAPLLGGDARRLRLAYSLLLTLPGTPVLYYGDEIGMGDDLAVEGRGAVRTTMQWDAGANGGFSEAAADALAAPVVSSGPFAYDRVNVAAQSEDAGSLLNWFRAALRARRAFPEFGRAGTAQVLATGDPRVLAHACRADGCVSLALHNLSGEEVEVAVPEALVPAAAPGPGDVAMRGTAEGAVRAFGDADVGPGGRVRLGPYGHRWLRTGGG